MRSRSAVQTAAFSAGTASTVIAVEDGKSLASIAFPALTSCTLTITGSLDGTNFYTLYGKEGSEGTAWTFTSFTGSTLIPLVAIGAVPYLKFTSSVNQTATIKAICE